MPFLLAPNRICSSEKGRPDRLPGDKAIPLVLL